MDFRDIIRARPYQAEHLVKDFAAFCRWGWPLLHPGAKLSWTPGHDLISERLVEVWQGRTRRLIVNCPPRFAKSSIVTIFFPIWVWLQDPTKAFLCASYEIDLATNHNLDRRRLMDRQEFRELFGTRFQLSTDRSQAGEFSNTSGGLMQAASTNSKAQGRGGDFIIVDDPLSADAATSETFRNETNSWFIHQLPQRLNNPSQSAIILVMQRLHQNDPTGFLLAQEESDWELLKLPLICEEEETIAFPISGRVWTRKKGDCLDPKRWSAKTVRQRQQNRLVWSGQFQQTPAPVEGNLIRVDEILYFGGRDPQTGAADPGLPESFERKIISVDASFKDKSTSDFVAVIVVGIVGSRRYLLHVTNAHLDLTGTENEIRNCHATYGPISATLVEDKANGTSVVAHLKEEISGVIAVDPEGGKMARVVATSPEFQANNWFIERNGPWTHKVVEQLTMFPNCKFDDILDAITQAAIWLQKNTYELGLVDYFKKLATGAKKMVAGVQELLGRKNPSISAVAEEPAPAVTKDEWRGWVEKQQAPPCPHPECQATCTVLIPGVNGKPSILCNQCHRVNGGELPEELPVDRKHCGARLQILGGLYKCQNCAKQWPLNGSNPAPTNGMSFAQYDLRKKRW
jgi:predicted phage terminase large subunit-like protein